MINKWGRDYWEHRYWEEERKVEGGVEVELSIVHCQGSTTQGRAVLIVNYQERGIFFILNKFNQTPSMLSPSH